MKIMVRAEINMRIKEIREALKAEAGRPLVRSATLKVDAAVKSQAVGKVAHRPRESALGSPQKP